MNILDIVTKRLDRLGWSRYRLVQVVHGKVTDRTVYKFLSGGSRINAVSLGHILDAVGLTIVAVKRPPPTK